MGSEEEQDVMLEEVASVVLMTASGKRRCRASALRLSDGSCGAIFVLG